ncbi:MAG: PKD domain-containing protein [Byssovorax sp.]
MNQVLNALALGSIAAVLAVATPACTKSANDPETTGYINAAITVGGAKHDVTAIQYTVVDASGVCGDAPLAQATSPLEVGALPATVLPPGSGTHAGANGFFVLPAGNYRVCATPMGANGPSTECAPTEGLATVIPDATNEIILVSQCQGDASGGVGAVVTLNDPPQIDGLTLAPGAFLVTCQTATLTASGSDPDGDAVAYTWSVTSSPPGSSPQLQATTSVATFVTDLPGEYQITVTITDVNGGSSSLTFPMHVGALLCAAQDQCHVAGSCDLSALACSNPTVPDGSTCDDGDVATDADVCSAGVCAGVITNPCACPAGFTTLPGGQCSKSYDIDASLLVNQASSCDATGTDQYSCNGPYGFQWVDLGGSLAGVTQVDVELETGLSCAPSARTAALNGAPVASFTPTGDCTCTSPHSLASLGSVPVSSYVAGSTNSVTINAPSCEGLSKSPSLNGAFARVTATYSLSAACGGVCTHDVCSTGAALDPSCGSCVAAVCQASAACCTTGWDAGCQASVATICGQSCGAGSCGDGVCDPTESCQSCAADCGACVTCPTTDLGSTVPQSVTGSTVGQPAAHTAPCVPANSNAPESIFEFTAPSDGTFTFSTVGSTFDTILYIQDGTCGGAPLACNDDFTALQSQVQVTLTSGQTVVVIVDGYGSASGAFTLSVQ